MRDGRYGVHAVRERRGESPYRFRGRIKSLLMLFIGLRNKGNTE
jgi:hypothetical protein